MPNKKLHQQIAKMPESPGVYQMLDSSDEVLYVGKARNLRARLRSYLGKNLAPKTARLMSQVDSVRITVAESDSAALLLEDATIKRLKPKYNILLRDDKSYPYLHVSTHEDCPRLSIFRGQPKGKGKFFGPFANAKAVRDAYHFIQKTFQLRQCTLSEFRHRSRPCIQHQISCCTAPCVAVVSAAKYAEQVNDALLFLSGENEKVIQLLEERMVKASAEEAFEQAAFLRDQIAMLRHVTHGADPALLDKTVDVIGYAGKGSPAIVVLSLQKGHLRGTSHYLPQVMLDDNKETILFQFLQQYYLSSIRGDRIANAIWLPFSLDGLDTLALALKERWSQKLVFSDSKRGYRKKWHELASTNAEQALATRSLRSRQIRDQLTALARMLELEELPIRIECIDISHTQGEKTVGSVVVFQDDSMDTSQYRTYHVSSNVTAGDDYAAIKEVVSRRIESLKKREQSWPDVMIIDGGKGQLNQAIACFDGEESAPVLMGISKGPSRKVGQERLWVAGREDPIVIPRDHPARFLLETIRDEAHRTAIGAHRKKRGKTRKRSIIESIPGIGPKKQQAIYQRFGGLTELKAATVEQIAEVKGMGLKHAKTVFEFLHRGG